MKDASPENILVSFSGGKTSAYMAQLLKKIWPDKNLVFVFANTGQEREETLIFVEQVDKYFGLDVVWVEAVVHHNEKKGSTHNVVSFETASRSGEPFEEVIRKYGIPNKSAPHCTRELKANPIKSYARSLGWKDYKTAIGIRFDEPSRVGDSDKFIYPLYERMIDKIDVNNFWERMPFTLKLQEHQGNCSWCWKKSDRKHFMLIQESPEIYDFPKRMEELYAKSGTNKDEDHERTFFRGHRSANDLFREYEIIASNGEIQLRMFDDENSGCSESCEPFGDKAA